MAATTREEKQIQQLEKLHEEIMDSDDSGDEYFQVGDDVERVRIEDLAGLIQSMRPRDRRTVVITVDGEEVAYAMLKACVAMQEIFLQQSTVFPGVRRQGLGTRIVLAMHEAALATTKKGLLVEQVLTAPMAKMLYKAGFSLASEYHEGNWQIV